MNAIKMTSPAILYPELKNEPFGDYIDTLWDAMWKTAENLDHDDPLPRFPLISYRECEEFRDFCRRYVDKKADSEALQRVMAAVKEKDPDLAASLEEVTRGR